MNCCSHRVQLVSDLADAFRVVPPGGVQVLAGPQNEGSHAGMLRTLPET